MSDKTPKKPFLGEEDIGTELDAWDATFDALHTGPEGGLPAEEPVMEWPAPAALPEPDPGETAVENVSLDSIEEEIPDQVEPMTLDRAIEDASTFDRELPDPLETDFSEIGAEQAPAALGQIL